MEIKLINSRWLLINNKNKPEPYKELPDNLKLAFENELKKEFKKHNARIELKEILRHSLFIADKVRIKYNKTLLDRIKYRIELIFNNKINDYRNKHTSYRNWISDLV